MINLKKENGHTLIELVIVMAMVGIVSVLIWTVYLSIHRTNIRAEKKVENLEDARLIINHITDNFQRQGGCNVLVNDAPAETLEETVKLDDDYTYEFYPVKEIIFDKDKKIKMTVAKEGEGESSYKRVTWQGNDTGILVYDFKGRLRGELLEFKVEIKNEGHGVVADQTLDVGTTLNLKYMDRKEKEEGQTSE